MGQEARDITKSGSLRDYTWENARGMRYAEIAMLSEEGITIYNSTGLSDAPPDVWNAVNAENIAQKYGLKGAFKNGPHWWLADRLTFRFGADVVTLEGMEYRWAATLPASLITGGGLEPHAYTVFEANKRGALVYETGKLVYELVTPEGDAYAMQGSNIEANDDLAKLGDRLALPEGWDFRARPLDEDLTIQLDGKVKTVTDDLKNVYNLVPAAG